MTLDEAIKHAEEVAEDKETRAKECIVKANSNNEWLFDYEVRKLNEESVSCAECAAEHRQLAEWLKELKRYKEQGPCAFCKHNTFEESAPCFRCPAGMSFAENKIAKVVKE